MKTEITPEKEQFILLRYPNIGIATQAIYDTLGITLEQMRSQDQTWAVALARYMLFSVCPEVPTVAIGPFVNRSQALVSKRRADLYNKLKNDEGFNNMFEKVSNRYKQLKNVQQLS